VLREAWYFCLLPSISFYLCRMLHDFGGYHLGCACGSWSDLSRVIGRDHSVNVCTGSCHDSMRCLIFSCYCFDHMTCLEVEEDHSDFVVFVFCIPLILPSVRFSCFAI
jgi:hypothetical protein